MAEKPEILTSSGNVARRESLLEAVREHAFPGKAEFEAVLDRPE